MLHALNPMIMCLQVVVDTAEAGKALLARGKLRSRVTLIPLDKVPALPCPLQAAGFKHRALYGVLSSRQLRLRWLLLSAVA